jgi:hypothetical protein
MKMTKKEMIIGFFFACFIFGVFTPWFASKQPEEPVTCFECSFGNWEGHTDFWGQKSVRTCTDCGNIEVRIR